ncbi:Regulatory protein BlaR1 [Pelotomaculum schinkii]|uniref:Regulatory protein BlaR1 n=1 Tax=Pelotomaculum schinkii TaxID=78350 RepID=A0A4Y7R7V2_9FIRM|nr:M56 family metallopeptidase [Pelotomaculum schinkii]TEB04857.1 Regulatory protein BlaR1 [Pelotomaculum schinkii]
MDIWQMSLSGAVLISAVVIVRALTLHKLPKKTFLVLWGVVICRLLIPFSIPSRFSFYTSIDMLKRAVTETTAFTAPVKTTGIPNMGVAPDLEHTIGIGAPVVSVLPVTVIWLAGMCACALFLIVAYIKCRREFQTALPVTNNFAAHWLREHLMRRTVQIKQSDKIKAPLTYGIFRPVVLLPKTTDWTDETRLRHILTHEFVHIKRFDALTKLLLASALCIHWFNPLVWLMYVLANRDLELSCDETVVQTFGETMKSAYAMTLIGLEERKNRLPPLCNNFSQNVMEERIVSIMKMKKTSLIGMILTLALIIGVPAVFATSANTAGQTDDQDPSVRRLVLLRAANIDDQTARAMSGQATMSIFDQATGKDRISWDEGKTWMTVEWYSYDEYKTWLEQEKENLQAVVDYEQSLTGEKGRPVSGDRFVWNQGLMDEVVREYERVLRDIKNGALVTKSIDGRDVDASMLDDDDDVMMTFAIENSGFKRTW